MKVFRINPEFRILRLTFNKSYIRQISIDSLISYQDLNTINHLNLKLFIFVGILQVLKFDFLKFRILETLNFHTYFADYRHVWTEYRMIQRYSHCLLAVVQSVCLFVCCLPSVFVCLAAVRPSVRQFSWLNKLEVTESNLTVLASTDKVVCGVACGVIKRIPSQIATNVYIQNNKAYRKQMIFPHNKMIHAAAKKKVLLTLCCCYSNSCTISKFSVSVLVLIWVCERRHKLCCIVGQEILSQLMWFKYGSHKRP